MLPAAAQLYLLPGSSERRVGVSGGRDAVTQCIYHLCCALLDSPARPDTRLYRPDTGFSDGGGARGGGGGSRMSDRDRWLATCSFTNDT